MPLEVLLAFSVYAVVSTITPGPNNIMLLSSGINFGFQRTLPHILGISSGFSVLVIAVGIGLSKIIEEIPALTGGLRIVGALYLTYLAWKIANSGRPNPSYRSDMNASQASQPLSFLQAALFQWVNPKTWAMALVGISAYLPGNYTSHHLLFAAAWYSLLGLPCVALWAYAGSKLRLFLQDGKRLRIFNISMAVLLVLSLYPTFFMN